MNKLPGIMLRGIVGGAAVGLLIGAYVLVLTVDFVVQREDFAYPLAHEQTEARYVRTVLVAFIAVFAAIGPFVAAATFGPWVRAAVYGLVLSVSVVVGLALVTAAAMHQEASRTCIDVARTYAVPIAFVAGPVIGLLIRAACAGRGRSDGTQ